MATIRDLGLGDVAVEGSETTVTILACLDDVNGVTYKLYDEDDECIGVKGDRDAAVEWAEQIADGEVDDENDQFLTDGEADADALASAGWGTDEDYGGYSDFDFA